MYSLTRDSTFQLARMVSGMTKVVSSTKSTEMPSTPILYLSPISHSPSSTSWKPGLEGSNCV